MKFKLLFLALFSTMTTMIIAQPQKIGWIWAAGTTGTGEFGNKIAADAQGNYYTTGRSTSQVVKFGNVISPYNGPAYLVKYDTDKNALWAVRPGANVLSLTDVVTNTASDIYAIGTFKNFIKLGTDSLITDSTSYFLVKYNTDGVCLWAKKLEHTALNSEVRLAIDKVGNTYVSGISVPATLGAFLEKRNPAGNIIWTKQIPFTTIPLITNVTIQSLAADNNDVYVSGKLAQGSIYIGNDTLSNASADPDIFYAKYNASGTFQWAKKFAGNSLDIPTGTTVDIDGDSYITGYFESETLPIDSIVLERRGWRTPFIAKLNASGNVLWAKVNQSASGSTLNSVVTDGQKNVFVSGYASVDMYDAFGNFLASPTSTTAFETAIYGIAADGNGNIAVSGYFGDALYLGDITLYASGNGRHNYAGFIAKLGKCYNVSANAILCYVSVDAVSKHNIIKWNNAALPESTTTIEIYRQTATNTFELAGSAPAADGSFEDTDTTLYNPYTGDPNKGSYSYKIRTLNTCGKYGVLSNPSLNTLFITRNNNYFTLNSEIPDFTFQLMRDNYSDGRWQVISDVSVDPPNFVYEDAHYPDFKNTASWRIQTKQKIGCTEKLPLYSNIIPIREVATSIDDVQWVNELMITPNPASNEFVITGNNLQITSVEIFNIVGASVSKTERFLTNRIATDISSLSNGIYTVSINTAKGRATKKLVIQK